MSYPAFPRINCSATRRLALVHPKAPKELLADALAALSSVRRPYQREVSVDLYLVAACSKGIANSGASIYVVHSEPSSALAASGRFEPSSVHVVSGSAVTQYHRDAVIGLVHARSFVHRQGGSIRAEYKDEYRCCEFVVRRGCINYRSTVLCDFLEVEMSSCAEDVLDQLLADALPAELFNVGSEREGAAGKSFAGFLRPVPDGNIGKGDAILFVQVAIAIAGAGDSAVRQVAADGRDAEEAGGARARVKGAAGARLPMS